MVSRYVGTLFLRLSVDGRLGWPPCVVVPGQSSLGAGPRAALSP